MTDIFEMELEEEEVFYQQDDNSSMGQYNGIIKLGVSSEGKGKSNGGINRDCMKKSKNGGNSNKKYNSNNNNNNDESNEEGREKKSPRLMNNGNNILSRGKKDRYQDKGDEWQEEVEDDMLMRCHDVNKKHVSFDVKDDGKGNNKGGDNVYMRSKLMYFNKLNLGRSEVKNVIPPKNYSQNNSAKNNNNNNTCKSAPQSTPIPILFDSSTSIFDPQIVVNTISNTFIPPHEMIHRSEFSVWEKDRKKIPQKYPFN